MAEAKHFNAEVRGNGFPYCLTKVDVNEVYEGDEFFDDGDPVYVDWITLGGWSKDNGAPAIGEAASKSLSLQNASKLFWNLNGLTGVDDEGNDDVYTSVLDLAAGSFDFLAKGSTPFDLEGLTPEEKIALGVEPKDRVCGIRASMSAPAGFEGVDDPAVEISVNVVRMYEGDVADEENFIGYGIQEPAADLTGSIFTYGVGNFPDLQLTSLARYRFEDPPWLPDKTIVDAIGRARAYGELYGIHFLGDFYVENNVAIISIEFTGGEVNGTFNTVAPPSVGGTSITMTMKDFTFYTYP